MISKRKEKYINIGQAEIIKDENQINIAKQQAGAGQMSH